MTGMPVTGHHAWGRAYGHDKESSVKRGVEHTHLMINDVTKIYVNTSRSNHINQDYKMNYDKFKVKRQSV